MLTIKNLYLKKGSPPKQIIQGISTCFPQGEISMLMGKSGAGKSSLMRCMALLETSYEGEVLFNGQSLRGLAASSRAQKVFYLSEIMVDIAVRKQGIATKITKCLFETAQSLNLKLVIRTRSDSPMVRVANNMQMSQIISLGEDTDSPNRVLYIKI